MNYQCVEIGEKVDHIVAFGDKEQILSLTYKLNRNSVSARFHAEEVK